MFCNVYWSFFAIFLVDDVSGKVVKNSRAPKYDSNPRPDLSSAIKFASLDICPDIIVEIGEFLIVSFWVVF